jgi:hypothetical protein
MLRVEYEAVEDLHPGQLADISEDRGHIRVRVHRPSPLVDVVRQLNVEIDLFLSRSHWFQLWKDEIVSRGTPDCPLGIVYLLQRDQPGGVTVRERRGLVRVLIDPDLSTAEFAAAMNPATEKFLEGGQWFQLYGGEIIDMTPESASRV